MNLSSSDAFISNFHSLNGITIGERRKELFFLLNQTDQLALIDFSRLQPRSPLEESLKLDSLIYLRRVPDLVEILKSENPPLIKKVLKLKWFILESLKDADDLLALFPNVSFNIKVKILNKLATVLQDRQLADSMFHSVYKKYSLNLALKLLPACSDGLVLNYFNSHYKQIFASHVLTVLKHRGELAEKIFDVLFGMNRSRAAVVFEGAFIHLAHVRPASFIHLYQKYGFNFHIGRRASRKIIESWKETLTANASHFRNLLHRKQAVASFGEDFEAFYANLFPKSMQHFPRVFRHLLSDLSSLSPARKLMLIEKTFLRVYGSDIWCNKQCVTADLLALAPLHRRLAIQRPSYLSEDGWICYSATEQSIPLLTTRISLTSDVSTRLSLVAHLVETCKINDDKSALEGVCRYFLKQHRNDHVSVRSKFLTSIKNMFELETLTEEHWICINELLDLFEMNHESFSLANIFLIKRIHYLLLNELPVEDHLLEYIRRDNNWCLFNTKPEFGKMCLLLIGTLLPQIALKHKHITLLSNLVDWNLRHKTDPISIFNYPDAIGSLTSILGDRKKTFSLTKIMIYCLFTESTPHLTNLCIANLEEYDWSLLHKLLCEKTQSLSENIDHLTRLTLKNPVFAFWRYCRNYTHLELPQKIVQICLDVIHDHQHSGAYRKRNAIVCLSYLMPADEFLAQLSKYYPTNNKAIGETREHMEWYHNQKAYTSCIKNVIPKSLALNPTLEFCRGDYLKLILNTLYSLSSNVNERFLVTIFTALSERAVSVRKHAIHLTIRVLDRSAILAMFNQFITRENNSSMRKFLLNGSFNLFCQDADDVMWSLVKTNIESVSCEDKEVIDILLQIGKVPPKYMVEYVLFIWNFLDHSAMKVEYIEGKQCELLRLLSKDVIQLLPKDFCENLIHRYFSLFLEGHSGKTLVCCIYNFACSYVIYCSDAIEQDVTMNVVVSYLEQCMRMLQDCSKYLVNEFLRSFCMEFLLQRCCKKDILVRFVSIWNVHMESHFTVDQYIQLQLTLLFVEKVHGLSMSDIGRKVAELAFMLSQRYGDSILLVTTDRLKAFYHHFTREGDADNNLYDIIEGIIEGSKSSSVMILAIILLKNNVGSDASIKCRHNVVIAKLKNMCEPIVNVYLNRYLCGINM